MTEKTLDELIQEESGVASETVIDDPVEIESAGGGFDFSFLKAETGEGAIEEYIDHPMNFNKSNSVARILRGMTGMIGNLRLAILDIGLGILEFTKERKE